MSKRKAWDVGTSGGCGHIWGMWTKVHTKADFWPIGLLLGHKN